MLFGKIDKGIRTVKRVTLKSNAFPGQGDSDLDELVRAGNGWWKESAYIPRVSGPQTDGWLSPSTNLTICTLRQVEYQAEFSL